MAEQKIGVRASSVSLGITVVFLYVIFVMLVTFGFGSYIYRTTWLTAPPVVAVDEEAGEKAPDTDIDNNIFLLRREQILQETKLAVAEEIRALRTEKADNTAAVRVSYGAIARAKESMRIFANLAISDFTEYSYELVGQDRFKYDTVLNDDSLEPYARMTELLDVLDAGMVNSGVDADTLAKFEDLSASRRTALEAELAAVEAANAASHKIQQGGLVTEEKINALVEQNAKHDESIAALRTALPLESVIRARLSSLALNIWIAPNVLLRLVSFPTIFLTLIVTIAAGALGTVVAFSRRYYSAKNSEQLSMSRLFVNVGEGIAAAIAIFLFSGAGMLALTQGGGTTNDVELSPYTVAFVAFLSGFMAEDAFAAIQAAGKRIFNTDDANKEKKLAAAKALIAESEPDGAA